MSSPKVKTPDPVQESKTPDLTSIYAARKKGMMSQAGTLLTGPSGVDSASTNTGASTLLGG